MTWKEKRRWGWGGIQRLRLTSLAQTSGDKLVKVAASLAAAVIVWLMEVRRMTLAHRELTDLVLYGKSKQTLIITFPPSAPRWHFAVFLSNLNI